MRPSPFPPVPEETAAVARAAFRKGNRCVRLRGELGALYEDADFAALFPARGRRALPPWRLALVTVLQFLEHLSDRQVADAVRGRASTGSTRSRSTAATPASTAPCGASSARAWSRATRSYCCSTACWRAWPSAGC